MKIVATYDFNGGKSAVLQRYAAEFAQIQSVISAIDASLAKYLEALKILPDDLVPIFDELLEHYKFAALKCHGRAMVSPLVIAELVLLGWRNAEDERQPKNSEELI